MGWIAYHKDGTVTQETHDGRPVKEGEEGKLSFIIQEDYGHKIGIDLINGVIIIDFEGLEIQNGGVYITNPKAVLYVADETSVIAELQKVKKTKPNKEGWFEYKHEPFQWRPIWFSRNFAMAAESAVKVVGLQTTLGAPYKRRNIKKMVSLLPDGRIAID